MQRIVDERALRRRDPGVTGRVPLGADRGLYSLHTITVSALVIAVALFIAARFLRHAADGRAQAAGGPAASSPLAVSDLIGLSTFTVNVLVALTIDPDYIIFLVGRYQRARATGRNRSRLLAPCLVKRRTKNEPRRCA